MNQKKLFLLDAFALIYRAYFAFSTNPRINSNGLNTSAVFGFTNTLLEVLRKEQPTHIAVVFDTAEPTVRHIEFAEYKAQREAMPEDLSASIPYVFKLLEGFNIPALSINGFEADDLIGALAKKAEQAGFVTYMMTPDKDYGQLVSENILIYKPGRGGAPAEKLGVKEICERYGIERPEQVIDILGLMGDSVDNIPGVPGIGEKTAIKLVQQFGSVENLLANTAQLKGKQKENLETYAEQARFSRKLATIITDLPYEFNEDELIRKEINRDVLQEVFNELEFRRLAAQILGSDETPVIEETSTTPVNETGLSKKTKPGQIDIFGNTGGDENGNEETDLPKNYGNITTTAHQYKTIATTEEQNWLIDQLLAQPKFCFDSETTGLDAMNAELVGLSFSWKSHEAYYVPFPEDQTETQALLEKFRPVFEHEQIEKIGQNIKYDLTVLKKYDIALRGKLFDTMIAHYLLQPDMRHNMDVLAETYLNYSPVSIETLIGKKGKNQLSMRDVPLDKISEYAAEDADITWQLHEKFAPELDSSEVHKLFDTIEMPLVPVLADMEAEGIRVDEKVLQDYSSELHQEVLKVEDEIQELAGRPMFAQKDGSLKVWNLNAPAQVGEVLFERMKLMDKAKKTKTGQYATGEDILAKIEHKHPIIAKILDYRELTKLKNTYVDVLPTLIDKKTGRIHTTFNQVVAATGRLSSDNPNLQNIPIRTTKGREIRKAFVARGEGWTLLSADYSQIELRVIAELSQEKNMIEAFRSGLDIHAATAARVYGVELADVTSDMRRNAKMVNFGIIYGISAFGLADRLNIARKEAQEIILQYNKQYPAIKDFMDAQVESARQKGYVETICKRRRYLRDINSANAVVRGYAERNAINAPIQGSAADMIKIAMIRMHDELRKHKLRTRLLLQVHDELIFDVPNDELEQVKPIIESCMTKALDLQVPIEVGMGNGANWLVAH
jgi:DNA polymerase I